MIIIRRNFSRLDEEQREFGVKRALKVSIGRTRRKIADKLYKAGEENYVKAVEKAMNGVGKTGVQNKELRNKILREEAPRLGTTVSYKAEAMAKSGGVGTVQRESAFDKAAIQRDIFGDGEYADVFTKGDKKLLKKVLKKNRKTGVAMTKGSGVEHLAHELGHVEGAVVGGKRGKISANDPRSQQGYQGSIVNYGKRELKWANPGNNTDFKGAVKDFVRGVKGSKAIVKEEEAASKSALKMMKRHGATKDELRQAKENLNTIGDTYRMGAKYTNSSALGRVIDIPSRRSIGQVIS